MLLKANAKPKPSNAHFICLLIELKAPEVFRFRSTSNIGPKNPQGSVRHVPDQYSRCRERRYFSNTMDGQERIGVGAAGFGKASNSTLEERARRIAASDGRAEVNDLDREEARRQLSEPRSDREEPEEMIAEGDRPDAGVAPASHGKQKERIPPDDESVVPEKLVREGVEEAEFDTRVRSAENEEG
jgi:hypothetical protein